MQSSCNCIHMCCSIQPHRYTDTSTHENNLKHVTYHHAMHAPHLFSFYFNAKGDATQWPFLSLCQRGRSPVVFHNTMPKGMQPSGISTYMLHAQIIFHVHAFNTFFFHKSLTFHRVIFSSQIT